MIIGYFSVSLLEQLKKPKRLNIRKLDIIMVIKMAEGRCYVCNQMISAKDKDTVVDKVVEHMMEAHHGWVWGDAMQTKNTLEKCPVCGATLGQLYAKCPNCGADLIEQYAILKATAYAH
ncbi:hypothetical protein ES705_13158 [subsurface metagenome]